MNINSIDESRNSDRTIKFARPIPVRGKNGGKPRGDSIEFSKYPVSLKEIPVYRIRSGKIIHKCFLCIVKFEISNNLIRKFSQLRVSIIHTLFVST